MCSTPSYKYPYIIPQFILILALLTPLGAFAERLDNKHFSVVERSAIGENGASYMQVYDHHLARRRTLKKSVLVKFKDGTTPDAIKEYASNHGLSVDQKLTKSGNLYKLDGIEQAKFVKFLREEIDTDEGGIVEYADIDEFKTVKLKAVNSRARRRRRRRRKKAKKAKDFSGKQWHINGATSLVRGEDGNFDEAWNLLNNSNLNAVKANVETLSSLDRKPVLVAVIDTGFDLNHPDIDYYKPTPKFKGYNSIAKAKSSRLGSITSLTNNDPNNASAPKNSQENHGTSIAGIIAAKNNGSGVTGGAANFAEVLPIRMIPDNGDVPVSSIIGAFDYAVEEGADVIVCAWGSYSASANKDNPLQLSQPEIDNYVKVNKVSTVLFASGNSGFNGFFNSPEAGLIVDGKKINISVGATDSAGQRARYSVFGPELDIVAPGGGLLPIYTTDRRDTYYLRNGKKRRKTVGYSKGDINMTFRGTSAAVAVAGSAAALIKYANPDLSPSEVREILLETAHKPKNFIFKDGKNIQVGNGRIDAAAAVTEALETL